MDGCVDIGVRLALSHFVLIIIYCDGLHPGGGGGGGGGGTLIFSYIAYVGLGHIFWVQNFEFQYFFWFSEK